MEDETVQVDTHSDSSTLVAGEPVPCPLSRYVRPAVEAVLASIGAFLARFASLQRRHPAYRQATQAPQQQEGERDCRGLESKPSDVVDKVDAPAVVGTQPDYAGLAAEPGQPVGGVEIATVVARNSNCVGLESQRGEPIGGVDAAAIVKTNLDFVDLESELGEPKGAEALRIVLNGVGPLLLPARQLGPVEAVSSCVREVLEERCKMFLSSQEFAQLDQLMVRTSPSRAMERSRLLRNRHSMCSAVNLGRGRRLLVVRDGHAFIATEASSLPESWKQIGSPPGRPDYDIRSVCVSPIALLAVDRVGRVLSTSPCEDNETLQWIPVKSLEGVEATAVQCRFGHIFVVTRTGELYAWGLASGDGTLARASSVGLPAGPENLLEPMRITSAPGVDRFGFGRAPIWQVACGGTHAVFVTVFGEAFAVGQGREGQLGNRGLGNAMVPTRMVFPDNVRVRTAACGLRHTLLVSEAGNAWGCGGTPWGELPVRNPSPGALPLALAAEGLDRWACEAAPRQLDLLPPLKDFFVLRVACGLHTSFFVSDAGSVLLTGSVVGVKAPFGRPQGVEPQVPYKLRNLPRIREISVSLNVPLKLPGISFSMLPIGTEARPVEMALFIASEELRAFAWGAPGGVAPRELCLN
mmetsp:Transcript_58923/g.164643  ORF Transcript_58923/g.164643 Transcript_58923/m.164643 type:complete len:637 (-) Transcript_58923:25-1935(-)